MIERLHPKEVLTYEEWRQTQEKIDELADAVNDQTNRLGAVEDIVYDGPEDGDAYGGCCDCPATADVADWDDDHLCHCGDVEEPHHHTIPAIRSTEESKAAPLLNDFVDYCRRFPDLRFWQALLAFSGYDKIYGGVGDSEGNTALEDTFYMTTKGPAIAVPLKVTYEAFSQGPETHQEDTSNTKKKPTKKGAK
jgi:hypothetical protein